MGLSSPLEKGGPGGIFDNNLIINHFGFVH
jgi:hypothetical protein